MHESDTYLANLVEGQEQRAWKDLLLVGAKRLGPGRVPQGPSGKGTSLPLRSWG